jgi:hypothetical protein
LPTAASIDRWFVPGTGFVKVITTINGPSGLLLQKTSLNLKETPKIIAAAPQGEAAEHAQKFSAGVSSEPVGEFKTSFKTDAPAIYARWQSRGLHVGANIRVVWIAENVADVAADYEIDDASTVTTASDAHGTFTLSQPEGGWTPGDYRVQFYVDDAPAGMVKLKISK